MNIPLTSLIEESSKYVFLRPCLDNSGRTYEAHGDYAGRMVTSTDAIIKRNTIFFDISGSAFFWEMHRTYLERINMNVRLPYNALKLSIDEFRKNFHMFAQARPIPISIMSDRFKEEKTFLFFTTKRRLPDNHFYIAGSCVYFDESMKEVYLEIVTKDVDRDLVFNDLDNEWQSVKVEQYTRVSFRAYYEMKINLPVELVAPEGLYEADTLYLNRDKLYLPYTKFKDFTKSAKLYG